MPIEVAKAIAGSIEKMASQVTLVWHGGEPLACGIQNFRQLIAPFSSMQKTGKIAHSIQTNGTLITNDWCRLFKDEGFSIGVSLDGNENQNSARVTWSDNSSYKSTVRGMGKLRENNISFGIIAVVNPRNIADPESLYRFFTETGCSILNVNIEEKEGLNRFSNGVGRQEVEAFWDGLFEAWKQNPILKIREFDSALGWLQSKHDKDSQAKKIFHRDFWPTIATNGDVVVLSPEFISTQQEEKMKFVVGNVKETDLVEIVANSINSWYVQQFFTGTNNCREKCAYYEYCGGGQASNKYFELGDMTGTETAQCVNTRQLVVDAVLDSLNKEN